VFSVVVFVAIGRRNHDESGAFTAVLETAAPFLIGLAVAWLIVKAWRRPTKVMTGLLVWPITVLVGMIVRNLVFDDGTATSFVVVATLFLGACFVGWRAALRAWLRRAR
jgi:MFS-type transporter involved in bile tolerance (Atg22 family)